jgi:1-acyl-sn-glycerol-3-phosphate acyltransferase
MDGELPGEPGTVFSVVRLVAGIGLRCWLRVYHRLRIVGREKLPVDRSFVMIANHASHLDALCLLSALPLASLRQTYAAAARDYFCESAARTFWTSLVVNAIPFDRQFAPWGSVGLCARLLQEPGRILILFPEGTRSSDGEVGEFKPGVAMLAAGCDVPIVPCLLEGAHPALPKGSWIPRPTSIRLTIGQPHSFAQMRPSRESARQICRTLRDAVLALASGAEGVPTMREKMSA